MRINLIRSALAGVLALALLLTIGCTEEQIRQAEAVAAAASARAAQAEHAVELATEAVAAAKELAGKLESEQALRIVDQAEQALTVAVASKDAAKEAADAAAKAVAAAKAAHEAGGSSVDAVVAGVSVAVPALGAVVAAVLKAIAAARALRQTVVGIEKAKETMSADQVAKLHASLSKEMDATSKQRVRLVKATAVASLLFALVGLAPAADLGLGPVPSDAALVSPGPIGSGTANSGRFTTVTATSTTASSSTATGALIVGGGIGCGEDIYLAEQLFWGQSQTQKGFLSYSGGNSSIIVGSNTAHDLEFRRNNTRVGYFTAATLNLIGDVTLATAGKGVQVKEGSNARMGTSTLVAGTVTVANTSVTASTRIFLTSNTDGGTPGWLRVSARVASTSFTITSSSGTDTSTVAWLLVEPAP